MTRQDKGSYKQHRFWDVLCFIFYKLKLSLFLFFFCLTTKVALILLLLPTDAIYKSLHTYSNLRRLHMNVTKDTLWLERPHSPAVIHAGQLRPLDVKVTPAHG